MTKLPSVKEAIILWQESISGVILYSSPKIMLDYIYHTTIVAKAAAKIAEKCNLNVEKAYILGLLHDYGKIQNEKYGISHFLEGYNRLIKLNYPEVAKICLTHCFPNKNFRSDDYISYKSEDLAKTRNLLSKIEYDEYDRLIQFCDILSEARDIVSYQERLNCIRNRYNLTVEQTKELEEGAKSNKAYFDNLCGCDVYELLNLKHIK